MSKSKKRCLLTIGSRWSHRSEEVFRWGRAEQKRAHLPADRIGYDVLPSVVFGISSGDGDVLSTSFLFVFSSSEFWLKRSLVKSNGIFATRDLKRRKKMGPTLG